ncbi:YfkD family protein [Cytobacillus gottheilii]|uniref:YfkD famly protein n=1 Tax=Cytobacillus gottheilii TaxID=859144 RepID=UPI003CD0DDFE
MKKRMLPIVSALLIILSLQTSVMAEKTEEKAEKAEEKIENAEEKTEKEETKAINIPSSVLNITKENTYPNPDQDMPTLQPSELTQQLIDSTKVKIENPDLIRMLNETTVNSTPFAFGYKAIVYLGQWPLNYESTETAPNWEYQKINTNYFDNRGGKAPYQIHYVQEAQKVVKGGLTAKIPNSEDVKKMMLLKATEKTGLSLAFETIIGGGTKKDNVYNIPPKRLGYLYGYAPAINEKGKVTYGEVFLMLKGSKKVIVVKNVTSQGIGAWIPVQDHMSFGFLVSERPR